MIGETFVLLYSLVAFIFACIFTYFTTEDKDDDSVLAFCLQSNNPTFESLLVCVEVTGYAMAWPITIVWLTKEVVSKLKEEK